MIQLPMRGNWTLVKWTFGQGRCGATWASADGGHESRLRGTPLVELFSGPADQHDRRREARPSDGLRNLEARQSRHEEVRDRDSVDERVEARRTLVHVHYHVRVMSQHREEVGVAALT